MVIAKQGTNVTWSIDGLQIAHVNVTSVALSGNVFVGYMDDSTGAAPVAALSFGLVDNVRVESLTVTKPHITRITIVGGNVQIDFTGATTDASSAFTIQSSATAITGYADVSPGASVSQLSAGSFRAVTALNGTTRYFRVLR